MNRSNTKIFLSCFYFGFNSLPKILFLKGALNFLKAVPDAFSHSIGPKYLCHWLSESFLQPDNFFPHILLIYDFLIVSLWGIYLTFLMTGILSHLLLYLK